MKLEQAIKLIKHPLISDTSKMDWADLGSGSGLFTNALAHILAPGSKIVAVDQNIRAFEQMPQTNEVIIEKVQADFTTDTMKIGNLDGILMANSLHFVSDKTEFIKKARTYIKQQGYFLIVEYDMDTPNPWVPYPISFYSLQQLFGKLGYHFIDKIHELPSRYNRSNIYSVLVKL